MPHEAVQANFPPVVLKYIWTASPVLLATSMTLNQLPINSCTKVRMAGQGEGHDDWLSSKERNKMDVHNVIIAVILMNLNYLVIITLLYQHGLLCNIVTKIFSHTLTLVIDWKALRHYTFWLYRKLKNRTWYIILQYYMLSIPSCKSLLYIMQNHNKQTNK